MESANKEKGAQGFASMERSKQLKIASIGGKKAHALGVAHTWTRETAMHAGRKGGIASAAAKRRLKNAAVQSEG